MNTDETTPDSRPGPCSPGSRWESAWLAVLLVADLASIPFHLILFTLTRARHRRAFQRALTEVSA